MKEIKLWHKKTPLVIELIHALYRLPDCSCGGTGHVITDDENVRDCDLAWMMEMLKSDDKFFVESPESDLVELICKELLEMTYEQRLAVFETFNLGIDIDELDEDFFNSYKEEMLERINTKIKDWPNK